jgi:hypothetical protein
LRPQIEVSFFHIYNKKAMAAGKYSFTIEQGATLDFEIQYRDALGNPINLTGYTGEMNIRSAYSGSGVTYLSLTSSIGDVYVKNSNDTFLSFSGSNLTTPPVSGSIGIYAGWSVTEGLTFTGSAFYDIEITSGSIRTRILEGRVQLSQQVTQ